MPVIVIHIHSHHLLGTSYYVPGTGHETSKTQPLPSQKVHTISMWFFCPPSLHIGITGSFYKKQMLGPTPEILI